MGNESVVEWDNHVHGGVGQFPHILVDENIGLQSMFQNVNANLSPGDEQLPECEGEQQNPPNMAGNLEHVDLVDHVMDVVHQVDNMVEDVQAQPLSMKEHQMGNANEGAYAPKMKPMPILKCLRKPLAQGTPLRCCGGHESQ